MEKAELIRWIELFISGEDISLTVANLIEVGIDDMFPDDCYMQDAVDMLASYRPGGGDYLYDECSVSAKLRKVKLKLEKNGISD